MGIAIMFGPGKGGPGKTTTAINLGAALALEFIRQRWQQCLHEMLAGQRSIEEQQQRLESRILQQLTNVLLQDQGLVEQNVQPVLSRNGVNAELQARLVPALIQAQFPNDVLIAEMDPQRNASMGTSARIEPGQKTTYDVLLNPWFGVYYAITPTLFGMDIMQATGDMYGLETSLVQPEAVRREYRLDDALRRAEGSNEYPVVQQAIDRYKVVLIDPPPTLGQLALNSIVAADKVIAVIDMGKYAVDAMDQLEARLTLAQRIQKGNNGHRVELGGIICNKYNQQEGYIDQCVVVEQTMRDRYKDLVFQTLVPQNARIFDSPTSGVPVQYNDPKNSTTRNATIAYTALSQECIERFSLGSEVSNEFTSTPGR